MGVYIVRNENLIPWNAEQLAANVNNWFREINPDGDAAAYRPIMLFYGNDDDLLPAIMLGGILADVSELLKEWQVAGTPTGPWHPCGIG